jgi:hypothetical protein
MSKQIILAVSFAFLLGAALAVADHDQTTEATSILPIDHKAIQYANGPLNDPVTKPDRDLAAGKTKLEYSPQFGWLPSILKHLDLNVDSQMLVFSKTSFQASKLPKSARARRGRFSSTMKPWSNSHL